MNARARLKATFSMFKNMFFRFVDGSILLDAFSFQIYALLDVILVLFAKL